jgi:hypothetical protein
MEGLTRENLREAETGGEDARVAGDAFFGVGDMEVAYHEVEVWEAACHGDRFREAT